jgi:hypothetical protein
VLRQRDPAGGRYGLVYIEGYVLAGGIVGTPHAWCARADGTVEDPTWSIDGRAYRGLPFSERYLRELEQRGNTNQILFQQHLQGWGPAAQRHRQCHRGQRRQAPHNRGDHATSPGERCCARRLGHGLTAAAVTVWGDVGIR